MRKYSFTCAWNDAVILPRHLHPVLEIRCRSKRCRSRFGERPLEITSTGLTRESSGRSRSLPSRNRTTNVFRVVWHLGQVWIS